MAATSGSAEGAAPDPAAILRSRNFVALLLFAAVIGVIVSFAGWCFLELIHQIQIFVYRDLPTDVGFATTPSWWSIPTLAIAGVITAFAIVKLPGNGGHVPAHGLQVGQTTPDVVPGVTLAAIASLGLGAVLGPEAPLIAIGAGLAVFSVKLAKRDSPPQLLLILLGLQAGRSPDLDLFAQPEGRQAGGAAYDQVLHDLRVASVVVLVVALGVAILAWVMERRGTVEPSDDEPGDVDTDTAVASAPEGVDVA